MADFEKFTQSIAEYNATPPTLADQEASALQVDSSGRLLVATNLNVDLDHTEDSVAIGDGTNLIVLNADGSVNTRLSDGTNDLVINADGSLNVTEANSADILTALQLIDNVVFSVSDAAGATDAGMNVLVVRDDALTTLAAADGDYASLRVNSTGALWVRHDGSLTVTATDLDIRDLDATQDNVAISDGTDTLAINADGSINVAPVSGSVFSIDDNGGSITVDATDLDIRNLSASQDNVAISDGTDTLAINSDGSINVVVAGAGGTQADVATDDGAAGDALVPITGATATILLSQAVAAGETYKLYAWNWMADIQGTFRLEVRDGTTLVRTVRIALNAGSQPGDQMNFGLPIEIAGAATRVVRVTFTRAENKDGQAAAAINGEILS